MKITYFAHLKNNKHREYDEDILYALKKMGHEVYEVDDREFKIEELIETANKSDMLLFHKGGVMEETELDYQMSLQRLGIILSTVKCLKVFWYVDKVYKGREVWMGKIASLVDYGFLVDETFMRRQDDTHLFSLKQASPDKVLRGEYQEKYACDIALIGKIYGAREKFVYELDKAYGDKFRVYSDIWGQDFCDLCNSAKIILSPKYPMDDFYWSARIYQVLAAEGFLIHPKLHGLKEHYTENKHYVGYTNWEELKYKIDYFLDSEKNYMTDKVSMEGKIHTQQNHTYTKRLQKLLRIVQ